MEYNEFEKKLKDKETIIVLDTNVILDLARYSLRISKNIMKIFAKCSDLIWIPNQVITEYDDNKKKEFGMLEKKYPNFEESLKGIIKKTKNELMKKFIIPERHNYSRIEEYKNYIFTKLDEAIHAIESYKETIAAEYIATSWYSDTIKQDIEDFVCEFKGKNQVGCKISEEEELEIMNEGESRYRNKMPPGFEDDKKDGVKKFGDLFLWKEILKLPRLKSVKNIIFITNDEKDDWWYKDKKGNPLNLRSELYKEFKEFNPGVSIDFMTMKIFQSYASKLYNLYAPYVYIDFNRDNDSFINRINEKVEADIKDALYTSPEDYLGVDIAIDYIEDCAFIKIKDTCVVIVPDSEGAGIGINYKLVYQVELHCDSEDYLEYDEYVFVGTIVVSIIRLIEKSEAKNNPQYFNEDDEYYDFEIIENDIEQLD